ncbi:MAG: HD domain-containing protein [Actinomycetia bacterium]|nr:HD domain-containing protein [Actinomycetes bacterium]
MNDDAPSSESDRAAIDGVANVVGNLDPELAERLRFLLELDRLKGILRRSLVLAGERRENSAEHSWHLALFALVLVRHANEPVDLARVVMMLLVHDVVEIDAGDTYIYDEAAVARKARTESRAADRIYGLLPGDEGAELRALWDEYERQDTADSRFAHSVDRLQPLLLNLVSGAVSWHEHGVPASRVREINSRMATGSTELWTAASALIDDAITRGILTP